MPDVSLSLAQARVLFPITEQRAYLFSGGLAPARYTRARGAQPLD